MDTSTENHRTSQPISFATRSSSTLERQYSQDTKEHVRQERHQQQVVSMLSGLQSDFSSLLQVISNRLRYDRTKEAAFDLLYQEMEDLKQDQEIAHLRPLYIDLILLIDRMNGIYNTKIDSGCEIPELADALKTLSHEVLEILYRRGVELIVSTSTTFDPKIQQVIEVIPAQNEDEDQQVVDVLRHGFKYKDVILRPEEVVIKKMQTT